ncbi:hypothetical protein ABEB36_002705 [Hypothenemus hampei]|uniref:Transposase n=1 Tax=Hypothenemus hampei TaxID=57062 RepID=A0ABD1F6Q9_HYPHA
MSRAISSCGTLGYLENDTNWIQCAQFFKQVNDWFDVFNVRVPRSDSRRRTHAFALALDEQNRILN